MGRPQESIALGSDSLVVQLRGALEVVGEGVVVCDAEGNEVYRNAEASAYSADRHGGVLADQVVTEQLRAALAGDEGEQIVELYGPSRRNLLIRAVTLSGDAGALGAVAVVEDISERRRLEAVRRDFVVNVSHELKTPVGALGLLAETLDGEDDPEVVSRFSSRLAMEAARLAQLIDDLLDLSRLEANETSQREAVDVESVLADAVGPLRVVAAARGIAIHVRCPRGLVLPRDRRDLVSALSNLVDNAIKYSGDHSSVQVSAELAGPPAGADPCGGQPGPEWVTIKVSDEGIGIPARDIERVFERFYRVDRARARATGGTGLGLSIVRHVIANHGGTISVGSVEGTGSTFTIRLPAWPPAAPETAVEHHREEAPDA